LAVALAAPAASTAVSALPDALPAPVAALPAASSAIAGTSSATVQALQQRMDKLEDALAIVQLAQSRLEQESDDRRAAPAPQASPNRHEPPARSRPKAVLAAASAPQPKLGAQLLSVDMWGGSSSVVVTSGLPGDTRTRTLRPGESLNGVTLRSADPATGQATFVSDGHVFTLSLRDGG
jgi:Meckel syndrome type 1 protein